MWRRTLLAWPLPLLLACAPTADEGETAPLPDPYGVEPGDVQALALDEIEPVAVGRFVTSAGCALCHSNHSNATAMRDSEGKEIAPFNLWQGTMMANSSRDPFWRAMVSAEGARRPNKRREIETDCMRCHAPMASVTAVDEGMHADLGWLKGEFGEGLAQVALDGVSCTVCHQMKGDNFGEEESFTGGYVLNEERRIYGPHENPAPGPMQNHVDYTPVYGPHVLQAELCATCHTLQTTPLDVEGSPLSGDPFLEQTTYFEWASSAYGAPEGGDPVTCQDCHMPVIDEHGAVIHTRIARAPPGFDFNIDERDPFGRHLFVGANTVVPRILKGERDTLRPQGSDAAFDAVVALAEHRLQEESMSLELNEVAYEEGALSFAVRIESQVGHKLPTGFPSRRVWVRARVLDGQDKVLFESGGFNEEGRLTGTGGIVIESEKAGGPLEPHHAVIERAGQVQVYEQIMGGADGAPTFSLLSAVKKAKDNRILPLGSDASHDVYPRIAPVGVEDEDFVAGADTVRYRLPFNEAPARVEVTLYYQGLSARFVRELFQVDTPEVRAFRTMLERAGNQPVLMGSVSRDL